MRRKNKNSLLWLAIIIFLIAYSFYLKIAAPAISPADGPEFAIAAYTLGIPHPPGYPFWVLCGRLFTSLPLGNIGWRANLVSLTAIALAGGIFTLSLSGWLTLRSASLASLAFLTALPVLQASTGAEVYPQLILWVSLVFYLLTRNFTEKRNFLLALLLGLGMSIHYLSLLFFPCWLILSWPKKKKFTFSTLRFAQGQAFKKLGLFLTFLLLGLVIFFSLPIRAAKGPYLSWGRVEKWEYFKMHLQRTIYHSMERGEKVDWASRWHFLANFFQQLFTKVYFYGGILLLIWGCFLIIYKKEWKFLFLILTLFFLPVIFLIGFLRFEYNELNLSRLNNYYLPVYLIGAAVIGYGFQFGEIKNRKIAPVILWLIAVLLITSSLYKNYPQIDQRQSYQVLDLGENLLRQLPKYTIFLAKSDAVTFPLWFMQAVNDRRMDISIITTNFMQPSLFDWYRYHIRDFYPWMFYDPAEAAFADKIVGINPWVNEIIAKFVETQPIYYELNQNLLISTRYLTLDGTVYKVLLPQMTHPDGKRTAWLLDKIIVQRGLKDLPSYTPSKIKETAFVYAVTHYFLAEKLRKNQQWPKALYYSQKALAIYPELVSFRGGLGLIYEGLGEIDKAVQVYEKLLNEYPDYQLANLGMSRIFSLRGDKEKSQKYWQNFQKTLLPAKAKI